MSAHDAESHTSTASRCATLWAAIRQVIPEATTSRRACAAARTAGESKSMSQSYVKADQSDGSSDA